MCCLLILWGVLSAGALRQDHRVHQVCFRGRISVSSKARKSRSQSVSDRLLLGVVCTALESRVFYFTPFVVVVVGVAEKDLRL